MADEGLLRYERLRGRSNDPHLLELSPYEGIRIVSMTEYYLLLQDRGLLA
jgi:hypothetical protein